MNELSPQGEGKDMKLAATRAGEGRRMRHKLAIGEAAAHHKRQLPTISAEHNYVKSYREPS